MRRSAVQCMPLFRPWFAILLAALSWGLPCTALGENNGFIIRDGRPVFPLGIYELPADNASLQAMADAGLNLVRCHNRGHLDRVASHGLMGCVPVGVQAGATDKLRQTIEAVADHPALAAWEGPDEVVWNFTAYSGLFKTAEDDTPHMAVEVTGLESLNGRHLDLLYTPDGTTIRHGELITRMQPRAVQVFATGRRWETTRKNDAGRRYQKAGDTNPK